LSWNDKILVVCMKEGSKANSPIDCVTTDEVLKPLSWRSHPVIVKESEVEVMEVVVR